MEATLTSLPENITRNTLFTLRDDLIRRETAMEAVIARFKNHYKVSLEELESRLQKGEGQEHPAWEDSIEWRNAVEELQRSKLMKSVLEWLLRSKAR